MKITFLDFEQPIAELEAKIEELRFAQDDSAVDISAEISAFAEEKPIAYQQHIRQAYALADFAGRAAPATAVYPRLYPAPVYRFRRASRRPEFCRRLRHHWWISAV